jgi:hypothetical protein
MYIAITVLAVVYITVSIVITFFFTRLKLDFSPPHIEKLNDKPTFKRAFKEGILIYHHLLSAYIAPKKGNIFTHYPQYMSMIFTHIYFFFVNIVTMFLFRRLNPKIEWTWGYVVRTDFIIFIVFMAFRALSTTLSFYSFFR